MSGQQILVSADDELRILKQAKVLARNLEAIEVNIRYNKTLLEFLDSATPSQYFEYRREMYADNLQQSDIKFEKSCVEGDLKSLYELSEHLQKLKNNPDDQLQRLKFAKLLKSVVTFEENNREEYLQQTYEARRNFNKQLNNAKRIQNKNAIQNLQKILDELDGILKKQLRKDKDPNTEFNLYKRLLVDFEMNFFNACEKEFVERYLIIKYETVNGIKTERFQLHAEFVKLQNRNIKLHNEFLKRSNERHADPELSDSPFKDIEQAEVSNIKHLDLDKVAQEATNVEEIFDVYLLQYNYKFFIEELEQQDIIFVEQEKTWLHEQKTIAAKEAAENAAREAAIAAALEQQNIEEQRRLAELNAIEIARQKQERIERREQHKLNKLRADEAKEAAKIQKEIAKRRRHLQAFIEQKSITSMSDGKTLESKFKVDMDCVLANSDLLIELFDVETKEFRYRDVEALLRPFNGELVTNTGSSHQTIVFNKMPYQILQQKESVDAEVTEVVKPLAKPHEPCLRHHNLELLQNAVASVLPDGWFEKLQPLSKVKLKAPRF